MTDKELTELTAIAFGTAPEVFSPLTDDGDALRLAVKLGMNISIGREFAFANNCTEHYTTGDKAAAIRRAIVRAAAEIGKEMK